MMRHVAVINASAAPTGGKREKRKSLTDERAYLSSDGAVLEDRGVQNSGGFGNVLNGRPKRTRKAQKKVKTTKANALSVTRERDAHLQPSFNTSAESLQPHECLESKHCTYALGSFLGGVSKSLPEACDGNGVRPSKPGGGPLWKLHVTNEL